MQWREAEQEMVMQEMERGGGERRHVGLPSWRVVPRSVAHTLALSCLEIEQPSAL